MVNANKVRLLHCLGKLRGVWKGLYKLSEGGGYILFQEVFYLSYLSLAQSEQHNDSE